VKSHWALFVDESGNFDDPDDIVAVSGVLLHHRSSLQPHVLKSALKRAAPLLPWPPHAWLLNQPAFTAIAIRELLRGGDGGVSGRVSSAAIDAYRAMRQADSGAVERVTQAFRAGDPDVAKSEIKLLTAAISTADRPAFDTLRHYGVEIRALVARLVTEAAAQERVADEFLPVWLVLSSETVTGDAFPSSSTGDRYLTLLEVLLERLAQVLRRTGHEHEVAVWVSRRDVANGLGGTEHLAQPRLQRLITAAAKHQPTIQLTAAGIGRSTDERGAGYVVADFAANASRVATFPRGRTLDEVYSVLRQRIGLVQLETGGVYSHCAANGAAAALIARAESEGVAAPRGELLANQRRALWACQQAWTWAESVHK